MTKLRKYLLVFYLGIKEIFEYRFDFFTGTAKYALMLLMMSLVWIAVGKSSSSLGYSQSDTIIYFFFSAVLYSLSNIHTHYFEDDIRLGTLSKYLLRPISVFNYYLSFQAARSVLETSLKVITMLPLLWILGYGFEVPISDIILFIVYIPFIYFFSFNLYMIISTMGFWLKEIWAIRWGFTIGIRFMSGTLVPISFLSLTWQKISFWLPFQHLAFTPISLIQQKINLKQAEESLLILVIWIIILYLLRIYFWKKGVRSYEGTGI